MIWFSYICILFLLLNAPAFETNTVDFDFENIQEKVEHGRNVLERIERKPFGKCWTSAIIQLKTGCKKLTDETQSRLAIAFANCHLQKSGRETYPCSEEMSVSECTRYMNHEAFLTYTEFFTHTSDICFYLQSQLWHQRTEETVSSLVKNSEKVNIQMEKSLQYHEEVLNHQTKSLENQKEIIHNEQKLKDTLHISTNSAKEAFAEMKLTAQQQKAMFSETFDGIFKAVDKMTALQTMLLGEFMTLHSIAFYIIAIVVCYFFTSTPRTAGARLFLFMLLSAVMVIERCIVTWTVDPADVNKSDVTDLTYSRLWFVRKVFMVCGVIILTVCAIRFKDYAKINNEVLLSIKQQLLELQVNQKHNQVQINHAIGLANGHSHPTEKNWLTSSLIQRSIMMSKQQVQSLKEINECDGNQTSTNENILDESRDKTFQLSSSSETETTDSDTLLEESLLDDVKLSQKNPKKSPVQTPGKKTPSSPTRRLSDVKTKRRSATKRNFWTFESPYNLRSKGRPSTSPHLDTTSSLEDLKEKLKHFISTPYVKKSQSCFSSDEEED